MLFGATHTRTHTRFVVEPSLWDTIEKSQFGSVYGCLEHSLYDDDRLDKTRKMCYVTCK